MHRSFPANAAHAEMEAFASSLQSARSVSAFCHENPDGDTLGAAIAIALIARRLGKESEVVSVDPIPPAYRFLSGADEVRTSPQLEPGLAVVCDAATLERVGSVLETHAGWFRRATVVNVDHHATNSTFGAINIVDPGAAATCQVVAELLPVLDVGLDEEIATALLAGIIRDSQGFSTESTTPQTLRAAAAAVEAGAPIEMVYRSTLHELPMSTMQLWALLLHDMEIALDGRVAYTLLTDQMLADTGTEHHDADGVVEFMARGQGAQVALLFRDHGDSTRVSIRTALGLDSSAIAGAFGGGGHVRRAGCTLPIPSHDAIQAMLAVCEQNVQAERGLGLIAEATAHSARKGATPSP